MLLIYKLINSFAKGLLYSNVLGPIPVMLSLIRRFSFYSRDT